MKKRILVISGWYPNNRNPIEGIFVQNQARILAQQLDVAVLSLQLLSLRPVSFSSRLPATCEKTSDGLIVCREAAVNLLPRVPHLSAWGLKRAINGMTQRGLRQLQASWGTPDLIHAHVVLPAGWAALRLSRILDVPAVLTEHSSPFSMNLQTDGQRRLVREALAGLHRVIAVSPSLVTQIQQFEPSLQPIVIGNVVDTDFFVPRAESSDVPTRGQPIRFLCVAGLSPQKGITYLLQAAKQLVYTGISNFELFIGGDGPQRDELEGLSAKQALSRICHFLGRLDPDQVRMQMQACDVFVLPSLHETFGIVIAEAMACGKPVIATKCGGPEFVVTEDAGILVEPANASALAEAMTTFIDGTRRFSPQTIRHRIVDNFSPQVFLDKILAVYADVLSDVSN